MKALLLSNKELVYTQDASIPKTTPHRNVLVKVYYAGICRTDVGIADNSIEHQNDIVLGHEFCGVIAAFHNGENHCDGWEKGTAVSCNPMLFGKPGEKEEMCGKDSDGAFAEYITVPSQALVHLPAHLLSPLGAYTEPVAASLAPIKHLNNYLDKDVCIFGNNRIAELTLQIIRCMKHVNIKSVKRIEELKADSYDCIIETEPQYINEYIDSLRQGGMLIMKSRAYGPSCLIPNTVAMKEITIQGCKYGDFNVAVHILSATAAGLEGTLNTDTLFGKTYELSDYEKAFHEARKQESNKIFFRICAE